MTTPKVYTDLREKHFKQTMECNILSVYGTPTRTFSIGERVRWGNRTNAVVVHDFGDHVYVVEADCLTVRGKPSGERELAVHRWIDIEKLPNVPNSSSFSTNARRPSIRNSSLDSLFHMHSSDGFVVDDTFQRGYVWTQRDRERLLDTIFDGGSIGTFLLARSYGYSKPTGTMCTYRTLTGDTVSIPAENDYTVSVIDGQQRFGTLVGYYYDRWAYKGKLYSQLSFNDQMTIEGFPISYALVSSDEGWTRKELVRLFIQANRGVPQTDDHMKNMVMLYESM